MRNFKTADQILTPFYTAMYLSWFYRLHKWGVPIANTTLAVYLPRQDPTKEGRTRDHDREHPMVARLTTANTTQHIIDVLISPSMATTKKNWAVFHRSQL